VSTQRLGAVPSTLKEVWVTNLASLDCAIMPQGGETSEFGSGAFYNTFKMWCAESTDILVGDRVMDGATTYTVRGMSDYNVGSGNVRHKSVLLVVGK
jgi:hypothetical protein